MGGLRGPLSRHLSALGSPRRRPNPLHSWIPTAIPHLPASLPSVLGCSEITRDETASAHHNLGERGREGPGRHGGLGLRLLLPHQVRLLCDIGSPGKSQRGHRGTRRCCPKAERRRSLEGAQLVARKKFLKAALGRIGGRIRETSAEPGTRSRDPQHAASVSPKVGRTWAEIGPPSAGLRHEKSSARNLVETRCMLA